MIAGIPEEQEKSEKVTAMPSTESIKSVKLENKKLAILKPEAKNPFLDHDKSLQATKLLKKQKELHQIELDLENKRKEFRNRIKEIQQNREGLEQKRVQLKERMTKFDKFIKENESKKQKALLKIQTEKKMAETKQQEFINLQNQWQQLQVKHEKTKRLLDSYILYQDYLQKTLPILPLPIMDSHDLHIHDILQRYQTLYENNQELYQHQLKTSEAVEKSQREYKLVLAQRADQLMVYNSELIAIQKLYEKAKSRNLNCEHRLEDMSYFGKDKLRQLGEMKLAIENLYQRALIPLESIFNDKKDSFLKSVNYMTNSVLIQGPNQIAILKNLKSNPTATQEDDGKELLNKLQTIQEQCLDLANIVEKAKSAMSKEKQKKVDVHQMKQNFYSTKEEKYNIKEKEKRGQSYFDSRQHSIASSAIPSEF